MPDRFCESHPSRNTGLLYCVYKGLRQPSGESPLGALETPAGTTVKHRAGLKYQPVHYRR